MTDVIPRLQTLDDFGFCSRQNFELNHARIHNMIDGDANDINTAARDPFVIFHHAYLDMIWEQFRQTKQTRYQRENQYMSAVCGGRPFSLYVPGPPF